ncbi:aspartate aminotransferase family protein [Dongia sp.]|uniref:aminotransferase family protein n=1 Tax=Dongia sp. TaxID=1977262 RepID=UPI0035AE7890
MNLDQSMRRFDAWNQPPTGGTQDVFYSRKSIVPLPMMERAEGIWFWDESGKSYIDASSGPMVSALGHGNPRVIDAIARQGRKLDYAYTLVARNRLNLDYASRLADMAGPGFERVSLCSGGSEAIDNALKFARQYALALGQPTRRRVISLEPSYHGATIGTLAAGGNVALHPFLDGFATRADLVPAPFAYRLPEGETPESYAALCARALERKIEELGPENVLAFLIEPVGGISSGAVVPPPSYFKAIREICTRHGLFLIFDEVLCGAGRSGKFITAHHWPKALPDIIVQAKGIGAGYAPLGAMWVSRALADPLAEIAGFDFSYSYNANPMACAAGLAVLDEFERLDLCANAATRGAQLRAGLEALQQRYPIIGDVRGMGLLLAVELVADPVTKASLPAEFQATSRLRIHGLEHGIMLYARASAGGRFGQWFLLAPPLTVTAAEIEEILSRTDKALRDLSRDAAVAGYLA